MVESSCEQEAAEVTFPTDTGRHAEGRPLQQGHRAGGTSQTQRSSVWSKAMRPHIGYPTPEDLPRKTSLHDAWLGKSARLSTGSTEGYGDSTLGELEAPLLDGRRGELSPPETQCGDRGLKIYYLAERRCWGPGLVGLSLGTGRLALNTHPALLLNGYPNVCRSRFSCFPSRLLALFSTPCWSRGPASPVLPASRCPYRAILQRLLSSQDRSQCHWSWASPLTALGGHAPVSEKASHPANLQQLWPGLPASHTPAGGHPTVQTGHC